MDPFRMSEVKESLKESLLGLVQMVHALASLSTRGLEMLRRGTHRKQHVLFVLVDSPGVRNRVGVFDDGHRLP